MDVCANPDLVPVQHSGGTEWAGMAGPSNGPAGLKYRQQGNCFVWIEDYEEAQRLLHRQLEINWADC